MPPHKNKRGEKDIEIASKSTTIDAFQDREQGEGRVQIAVDRQVTFCEALEETATVSENGGGGDQERGEREGDGESRVRSSHVAIWGRFKGP